MRGNSSRSSGQARRPVRSSPPATASATACARRRGELLLQRVEVLAARHFGAVGGLDGERDAKVRRAACRGRTRRSAPGCRCSRRNSRCSASSSGSRSGSIAASTARAVSGAGTKLRRRSFGRDRISAVTNSSRNAGTCQANSSPPRRASTSTGTCTVTPSSVGARLEAVGQGQRQVAGPPGVRLVVGVLGAQQVVAGERQQVRSAVPLLLPPAVEVPRRHDVGGDARVVEGIDLVVADQQVAAAGTLLDLGEFLAQPRVVAEEVVPGLPVALDQRVSDEQLAGELRVEPSRSRRGGRRPAAARRASPARRP